MPAKFPEQIERPNMIICEGAHDEAFFSRLIAFLNLNSFEICYPGNPATQGWGKDAIHQALDVLVTRRGFKENLKNIIIAADNDIPGTSFQEIKKQIQKAKRGYPVPDIPLETALSNDLPSITVLLIPGLDEAGCLETICLKAVRDQHPEIFKCVETFGRCVEAITSNIKEPDKFHIRCFLSAVSDDPYKSLNNLFSQNNSPISFDHDCFWRIKEFLTKMDIQ